LGVFVEGPGVEGAADAVVVLDAVGYHVVLMGERVECPAGEVRERRHGPSLCWHGLTVCAGDGGVALEPVQCPVVTCPDRVKHRPLSRVAGQEGEHAQGLLGRECEVVADPDGRWSPSADVSGEFVAAY
jgi:hypothetical protein